MSDVSKCFKLKSGLTDDRPREKYYWLEIHHPPEAIEEVEVPVYAKVMQRFGGGYHEYLTEKTIGYIKLKASKECGLYVREEQDHD